jgi:hypothetical protein
MWKEEKERISTELFKINQEIEKLKAGREQACEMLSKYTHKGAQAPNNTSYNCDHPILREMSDPSYSRFFINTGGKKPETLIKEILVYDQSIRAKTIQQGDQLSLLSKLMSRYAIDVHEFYTMFSSVVEDYLTLQEERAELRFAWAMHMVGFIAEEKQSSTANAPVQPTDPTLENPQAPQVSHAPQAPPAPPAPVASDSEPY